MRLPCQAIPTFIFLALAVAALFSGQRAWGADDGIQKAILVTGASSGIGRKIAERLAGEGHFVYAGARKTADIAELNSIENMQGIRLDVTVQTDIDAAVESIASAGRGLHGVVNNAGVIVIGPMAEIPESELDFVFDVNVYGPYRLVRAFTPMLIESSGRIVNISSMAGIVTGPAYGAYSMSKHAVEAFTDSLAREMSKVGVSVSAVAPGAYRSKGAASYCRRRAALGYEPGDSLFPELARDIAALCDRDASKDFPEPDPVADAVLHALLSAEPRAHYLATPDQLQAGYVIRDVINDLVVLNGGHRFSYSRDELVRILDERLAAE
jgi:NAD(P)-dependent dehydrogenase (short-subunit alcohol dehydrogenase family)